MSSFYFKEEKPAAYSKLKGSGPGPFGTYACCTTMTADIDKVSLGVTLTECITEGLEQTDNYDRREAYY